MVPYARARGIALIVAKQECVAVVRRAPSSPIRLSVARRCGILIVLLALAACGGSPLATATPTSARPTPSPTLAAQPTSSPATPVATFATSGSPAATQPPRPNSLISRGKPVFASRDVQDAAGVVDGHYCTRPAWRTTTYPTWLAIKVGAGPQRLLLSWNSGYTGDYLPNPQGNSYGLAGSYTLQTSADSTDGTDGTWRTVVTVSQNVARTRAHAIPFEGDSWVKMTVTAPAPGTVDNLLGIDEIDIHDASAGTDDSVIFVGDSITAAAFFRCDQVQPSYAALVHASLPAYFPAIIDGGVGGVNSSYGVTGIDDWLALSPDFRIWALGYGTNDAWQSLAPAIFERQMQQIIDAITAAGRQPVLARIPFARKGPQDADVQALNAAIDRLTERNHLPPGPDLYQWFKDHPEQLGPDGVHPNDAGSIAINQLWFAALQPLYRR